VPGKTAVGHQPLPTFAASMILYVFVAERQPQIVVPAASLGLRFAKISSTTKLGTIGAPLSLIKESLNSVKSCLEEREVLSEAGTSVHAHAAYIYSCRVSTLAFPLFWSPWFQGSDANHFGANARHLRTTKG